MRSDLQFAEGEPCRERAPDGKGIRSTLVPSFAVHDGINPASMSSIMDRYLAVGSRRSLTSQIRESGTL